MEASGAMHHPAGPRVCKHLHVGRKDKWILESCDLLIDLKLWVIVEKRKNESKFFTNMDSRWEPLLNPSSQGGGEVTCGRHSKVAP